MDTKIGEMALNTRLLLQAITALKSGEGISYDEMKELIGRDVRQGPARSSLASARRIALRDHGVPTVCEKNSGILRPANEDIPQLGKRRSEHIHRQARLGRRELETVDIAALPNDAKIVQLGCLALLGALEHFTRLKVVNSIQKLVDQSMPKAITLQETIAVFERVKN